MLSIQNTNFYTNHKANATINQSLFSQIFSEHLKFKHSFSKKLLLFAPVATIALAWFIGGFVNFQYMSIYWWYAFILCGVIALLSGYSIRAEDRAGKFFSVFSMPVNLQKFWIAKVIVTSGFLLITSLAAALLTFLPRYIIPQYAVFLLPKLLVGYTVIGISMFWQIPLCMVLAQKAGMFIPVLLNIVFSSVSTMFAGFSFWWVNPYIWTAKLTEILFGIKPTGELADNVVSDPWMILILTGMSFVLFILFLAVSSHWFSRQEVK